MMNAWGMTDIGLVRKDNQDAYAVRHSEQTGHTVAVVCDGMGGPRGGGLASSLAVEVFLTTCLSNLSQGMSREAVAEVTDFAVANANAAVYEKAAGDLELRGMGTTLVSVIAWEDLALINNVGDSRAYLLRQGAEEIQRVTKDHSLVEKLVDLGNITAEEARSHPDRNLITRALGPDREGRGLSDRYEVTLEPGDCLLLCTDGLIETVTDQEMAQEIRREDRSGCMGRLLDIARSRGAADNLTAVLLQQP